MKKSHPLRHRILAARRARKARTLAARRQVEALAALLAFRRACRDLITARRRRLPSIEEMIAHLGLNPARMVERIIAEQACWERLGIPREITFDGTSPLKRRA